MFITNIEKLDKDLSKYYICDKSTSEHLIKNGFPLLSAIYKDNKYIFMKTNELLEFVGKGGEWIWTQY